VAADKLRHFIIYPGEADAVAAGFTPRDADAGKVRAS
jgi:hypothetical protein